MDKKIEEIIAMIERRRDYHHELYRENKYTTSAIKYFEDGDILSEIQDILKK